MITYTYIVRCPECEDEFFDFFDEAKDFAMGCLTKKPIITQTEVQRNDFGECTDHCDLGTVWSWEDMMKDAGTESTDTVFSKAETFGISEGLEDFDDFDIGPQSDELIPPEFDDVFSEPSEPVEEAISKVQADYLSRRKTMTKEDFDRVKAAAQCARKCYDFYNALAAKVSVKELRPYAKAADKFVKDTYGLTGKEAEDLLFSGYAVWKQLNEETQRKPIPEGMTIEQLVEEMEENEDTVECTWCNDLFEKSECRKEVNLGWLCSRCQAAIMSRGESLTFKEGNYWDDEEVTAAQDTNFEQAAEELTDRANTGKPLSIEEVRAILSKYNISQSQETLTEAAGQIPNLTFLAQQPDARERLLAALKDQRVPGVHTQGGDSANLYVMTTAIYKQNWGAELQDIAVTPQGRILVSYTNNRDTRREVKQQDLEWFFDVGTLTRTSGSAFLTALKNTAIKLNKELDTRTRAERHNDNAATYVTQPVAEYLRDHITNLQFKIPMMEYSGVEIQELEANEEASEEACEAAATKINGIHNRFYDLPFAREAEALGMVTDRVPNEPAAWISSSWGAECKITFDAPLADLQVTVVDAGTGEEKVVKIADIVKAYQWKSTTKLDTSKKVVDCYSLAVLLITRYFDNDVRFFDKKAVTETLDVSEKPMLPEIDDVPDLIACPECGKEAFNRKTCVCEACKFN